MLLGSQGTGLALGTEPAQGTAQSSGSAITNGVDAERSLLRLALFDTVGLAENVSDSLRTHVEEIFEPIGVAIEWHEPSSVSDGAEPEAPYYLKVMLVDKEAAAMGYPANAMGIAFGSDLLPDAVWLFEPVIRRNLQSSRRKSRPLSSEEMGRAYSRVLAHEVIHAFANDMRHADSGLMAPEQTRNALISARTSVDAASSAAFLAGLARVHLWIAASGQ